VSTADITLKSFPYTRDWTQAEFDEILDRKDTLVEALTDALGPAGQMLWLPAELIHILAFHLALAGALVDDQLAWIVSKPYAPPPPQEGDENREDGTYRVTFEGLRHWVLKEDYTPPAPDPVETNALAQAAADKIRRQLSPQMTEAVMAILAERFKKNTPDPATRLDRAEVAIADAELRDIARKDGDA